MAPPPAKKHKQSSLLSFFGGAKQSKMLQDGGYNNGSGHCSLGVGEVDEVDIHIHESVKIVSVSSPPPPEEHPSNAGEGEKKSLNKNNERQNSRSSPLSPSNRNDLVCTVDALAVSVSPTGSNADFPITTTDINPATICTSSKEDIDFKSVVVVNDRNDDIADMNEEEDDDSSSGSSSNSDEASDVNDMVAEDINVDGKSEYEILREKNIARNNARLKELGLLIDGADSKKYSVRHMKQTRKQPKANSTTVQRLLPTRRSRRLEKTDATNLVTTTTTYDDGMIELTDSMIRSFKPEEKKAEESELFSVSPLLEYQMVQHHSNTATDDEKGEWKGITSLIPSSSRLIPPSGLNSIYSLQFYPSNNFGCGNSSNSHVSFASWLVGAGKSGIIALWDCSKNDKKGCEHIDPVISWKGHSGRWIADARFLPPPHTASGADDGCSTLACSGVPSQLITAGNDGTVCHWDLMSTSVKTGMPKLLNQSSKALHASGIFSMDVSSFTTSSLSDIRIVTGSKDKTIAVSTLDTLDERPMWRSDFHTAKVGSVNFSSAIAHGDIQLIASASDDGLVAIHDTRLNGISGSNNCVAAKLEDIHFKPHSAVWLPGSVQIFLTG